VHCDEIWVRDTVNTNFMEGVLLIVSTGFAPGSIYGLTLQYSTSTSMAISLYVPSWIQYLPLSWQRPLMVLTRRSQGCARRLGVPPRTPPCPHHVTCY
jgi:hypothetical protein